ncbi:MAG: YdiU family protein [Xanthomonadales bacterium]|nr:YdiU family protein [Xanthomonadales bacterium]
MTSAPTLHFDNSYAQLPGRFYSRQLPEPVSSPSLIRMNHTLATELGVQPEWLESRQGIEMVAGNFLPEGAEPIATVYAGHQFGGWSPQLGDGRAVLLGEVLATDGERYDIQLKGSGRTAYSRGGDGRAPLGPVLREYIVSEAMAVLGVPTTRALGAVTSGDIVMRDGRIEGAVLARVAKSHIRIGTFQYFAAKNDTEALQLLADHVIQRHFPETAHADHPVRAMLDQVVAAQARLIAQWQLLGFIHGVMNTDNMLLSGETIDYGPCAFMDEFDVAAVYSSIDHQGRYAYRNQPHIAHWNLSRLVLALLPLLDDDQDKALASGQAAIDVFPGLFQDAYRKGMGQKLGISQFDEDDEALAQELLTLMQDEKADFTLTFRRLSELADPDNPGSNTVSPIFDFPDAFKPWLKDWRKRLSADARSDSERQIAMYSANPAFIPRNHLVEEAIEAAAVDEDFTPFHSLVDRLSNPFEFASTDARLATPPQAGQVVQQTFCGT